MALQIAKTQKLKTKHPLFSSHRGNMSPGNAGEGLYLSTGEAEAGGWRVQSKRGPHNEDLS